MKKNKLLSLLVICGVYIVAGVAGWGAFVLTGDAMSTLLRFFLADAAATVTVWAAGALLDNASVYDPYWSMLPIVLLPLAAAFYGDVTAAEFLLISVVAFWGVRLTYNCVLRFNNMKHVDWRYVAIRDKNPKLYLLISLVGIHMMPTVVVFAALVPALTFLELSPQLNVGIAAAAALCVLAALLELLADAQMQTFKRNPDNKGKICNDGVWKYSRHPNYLGEIIMWWGVYLMMLAAVPALWWLLFCPLINNLLFLFVSIPMMEKRELGNKPLYAEYMQSTGKLLPGLGRKKTPFAAPAPAKK